MTEFACRLDAFDFEQGRRHAEITHRLFDIVGDVNELQNGYRLKFPSEPSILLELAEFVTLDRLCCPFITFKIEVEGITDPAWLYLTGPEGVKPFIYAEFRIEAIMARANPSSSPMVQ